MTDLDQSLADELARLGPSEWAFDTLLKVVAFGLHDSNRDVLREATKTAQRQFREAVGTCPGCGHEPHVPDGDLLGRDCLTCSQTIAQRCLAKRQPDGSVTYRR